MALQISSNCVCAQQYRDASCHDGFVLELGLSVFSMSYEVAVR